MASTISSNGSVQIRKHNSQSGTTSISVALTNFQYLSNAGSSIPASLTGAMWNYSTSKYFECTDEPFSQVQQDIPAKVIQLAQDAISGKLEDVTKFGIIKLFQSLGSDPGTLAKTFGRGAEKITKITHDIALGSFDISELGLDVYLSLGYSNTDIFKDCSVNEQNIVATSVFDHSFFLEPEGPPTGQPVFGVSISGKVFDASSNQPIANALVSLAGPLSGNPNQVTGSDGSFMFSNPIAAPMAQYSLSVSQFGYIPSSAQFTLSVGQSKLQDFYLAKPGPKSCVPSGAMAVLVHGSNVDAYLPDGSYQELNTGVDLVPIEDTSIAATHINTPSPVNSCSSNPATGETVCTANNSDIYTLAGQGLLATLTSAASGALQSSGGACANCGVSIDPTINSAIISMSLANGAASGFQMLDLGTNSLSDPIFTHAPGVAGPNVSESFAAGIVTEGKLSRRFLLSPSEDAGTQADYQLFDISFPASPQVYGFAGMGTTLSSFADYDSAAIDCTTGLALATEEDTSNIFVTDLTQASFTPATSSATATWTAPNQLQNLPEFSTFSAGTTGITIAPGSHLGLLEDEFGNNAFGAIELPSTSGTGTPAITDWVVGVMPSDPSGFPWSIPLDPHGLTAYVSPNTGKAMGLLMNRQRTYVAVFDLQALLGAARSGGHTLDPSVDLVASGIVRFIPVQ